MINYSSRLVYDGRKRHYQALFWSATIRRLVENDTRVNRCNKMMNKTLSLLPIDLNNIFAGRVVATGIINGASLKTDDCVIARKVIVLCWVLAGACWLVDGSIHWRVFALCSLFAHGLVTVCGDHLMMSGHEWQEQC